MDQLLTVRHLSEKVIEKHKKMVAACMNLEKTYNRVGRDQLWKELEKSEACVRVKGEMSSWFPIMCARSETGLCHVTMVV